MTTHRKVREVKNKERRKEKRIATYSQRCKN
jgi:hypothetical protein